MSRRVKSLAIGVGIAGVTGLPARELSLWIVAAATLFVELMPWVWRKIDTTEVRFLKGTQVLDHTQAIEKRAHLRHAIVNLAGICIDPREEVCGILLAGATGVGKSQVMMSLLDIYRMYQFPALVMDPGGSYTRRYFDPSKDVILNPFDGRSSPWSPLAEISDDSASYATIANACIPPSSGADEEWRSYARMFYIAVMQYCHQNGITNEGMWDMLARCQPSDLPDSIQKNLRAYLAENNERFFASVRAVAYSQLAFIEHLHSSAGKSSFSVHKHIVSNKAREKGWIFVNYMPHQQAILANFLTCIVDVASVATLSLDEDHTGSSRVIFALDELPLLGHVPSLHPLTTNGRKRGAVVLAGVQSVSQVRAIYGMKAESILGSLKNWVIFQNTEAESAQFMSQQIGQQRVIRRLRSGTRTRAPWGWAERSMSEGWTESIEERYAVLPTEIQELPPMHAFVKIAGAEGVEPLIARVQFPHPHSVAGGAPSFVARNSAKGDSYPAADQSQRTVIDEEMVWWRRHL